MRHQSTDDRKPAGYASAFLRGHAGGNAPPPRTPTRLLRLALALTSGAQAAGGSNAAHSQGRGDGQPEAVHIGEIDVPRREGLDALPPKLNLRYGKNDTL